MLGFFIVSLAMLSGYMQTAVMLSVVLLYVVSLSVVAPQKENINAKMLRKY
jgi:hypothetical protein